MSKEKDRLKKWQKILGLLLIIGIFAFIILISIIWKNLEPSKINSKSCGEECLSFCTKTCGENKLITSVKNSSLMLIGCECLIKTKSCGIKGERVCIDSNILYFDSETLQNLNKTEIYQRQEK